MRARGVHILEPEAGFLACGMVGEGRLADPDRIVDAVWSYLAAAPGPATPGGIPRDLTGDHVLVTAGPTIEDIDPVRYLTNRSSGKMGYAVARAAQARGATVTLVSGPTRLTPPEGVETIAVRSTREMYGAVLRCLPAATMVIKAAAVCDYRPRQVAVEKLKKTLSPLRQLDLEPTEDILAAVGAQKGSRFVVGFAAETGWSREAALEKLRRKGADLLVFNDVTESGAGFDTDTNRATFVLSTGETRTLPLMTKDELAHEILNVARQQRPVAHPDAGVPDAGAYVMEEFVATPSVGLNRRVLVVDDEAEIRLFFKDFLSDCQVCTAADGSEVAPLLASFRPHLVITDLRMPRQGGWLSSNSSRPMTRPSRC